MFSNYFKTAFRNILRSPLYSIINISGLAIGIISVIVIFLWVNYELGYDRFNKNNDRIYKVQQGKNFSVVPPLFNYVKNEFPDIESIVRISADGEAYIHNVTKEGNNTKVNNILYSSPDFNKIFTCRTLSGNIKAALKDPGSIILTRNAAIKIFGKTDIIGKSINYKAIFPPRELNLTVEAVIDDFPSNSTLKFEGIIPFAALDKIKPNGMKPDDNWRDGYCNMYILLKKDTDLNSFKVKLKEYVSNLEKVVYDIDPKSNQAMEREVKLVSLKDVYFFNNNKKQLIGYISVIGLLILLIAVINYINLSIAKLFSVYHAFLIRKINGASRFRLISLILTESVQYSLFAVFIAIVFIEIGKPLYNNLLNIELKIGYSEHPGIVFLFILFAIVLGVIAGLYPALKLTSNISVNIAQNNFSYKGKTFVRKLLVVIQFIISIALIIGVFTILKQFHYIKNKDLGFDDQQVIYTRLNSNLYGRFDVFKEKLLENPNIKSVGGSQNELGQVCVTLTREVNGTRRYFQELPADPDFIKTMGLKLIMGRNFSWDMPSDQYQTLIISETAVKAFDLDSNHIIGTEIYMYDRVARVIGVIKDFYFQSFHHKLDPFMLYYHPGSIGTMNIKISKNNIPETIKYINKIWGEFSPDIPFEYHFLNKTFENLYKKDKQLGGIIIAFSLVAIIIACLGLLGLISFIMVQRTKEIGIRKVNGAKTCEIILMIVKDFIFYLIISFIIACPVAYYAMNKWLQNFAYKTNLSWWIFLQQVSVVLAVALLTVSFQSYKAASKNPVEALRYE